MARRNLSGARVLLTGASSGIGRSLAMQLGAAGARMLLTARRASLLEELADEVSAVGPRPIVVAGDITDGALRERLVTTSQSELGGLDVLINNAGIGALGRFETADPARLPRIMDVNFFAAVELVRAALPLLKQSERAAIVNMGSILGHRGIPHSSEYCASKFALHGFSESIRAELAPHGIDVLLVAPGTTETEFDAHRIEQQDVPWPKQPGVSPDHVARATVRALQAGRHEIIPNARGRLLCLANRLSPRLVDRLMARYG